MNAEFGSFARSQVRSTEIRFDCFSDLSQCIKFEVSMAQFWKVLFN